MALISSKTKEGKVFEKYSMLRNGQPREFTFVFEDSTLIGLAFSYVEDDAAYFAVTEFTGVVDEKLFEMPETNTESLTVENASIEIDLAWSSGTIVYTGEVDENNLPHGLGTGIMEADADKNAWTYVGLWEHGHLSGKGSLRTRQKVIFRAVHFRKIA